MPSSAAARCDELAHAVLLAGGDDEVLGLLLLQHQPLHLDVVARMAPVAQRVEVAEVQAVLQPERDARERARDLARDEGLAAQRALVVEQDAVAGVHAVGLAVVDRDPVGVELGHRVRASADRTACVSFCGVSCTRPYSSEVEAW